MSNTRLPKLTTTSFALLGLLQRRPWSAYELTRYMRSSILRAVWPRAESHLYSEPKLLEKRGFATSRQEQTGARKRTVYSITPAGQAALVEWLRDQPDTEFRFEYELLVRFAFAAEADAGAVVAYLEKMREDALRDAEVALAGIESLQSHAEEFLRTPHAPYSGALMHLVCDQLTSRLNWAESMLQRVQGLEPGQANFELAETLYEDAAQRLRDMLKP